MGCLQLPVIRVEEAGSWTQRFLTRKKSNLIYDKQIWKQMFAENSTFQVNRKKNATWRQRLTSCNRAAIFVSTLRDTANAEQSLLAINLASQKGTTKLYFFFSGKETIQT